MPKVKEKKAPLYLKVPPHNIEAEQAILGGILMNNNAMNQIMDILSSDDFYREANMSLFQGMVELYNRSEPIDVITLSGFLTEKNLLEKVGGIDYLGSLVDAVSTSAGIVYHAEIVKNLSVRRKLISQCSAISESCFQDWERTEDLLETAEQAIFDIADEQVREGFQSIKEVITGSLKKLETSSDMTGVSTGFEQFDSLTAGLQPSDLIVIAGRPSMGKTALALNIGYNAAQKTKKGVAIFSLEMSKPQLGVRLLGFDSGIDSAKLRTGFLRKP